MPTRPTVNNCYRVLLKFASGSGTFLGETHIDIRIPTFPFDDTSCADLVDLLGQALLDNNVDGGLSAGINIPIWTVQNFDDTTRADIDVPSDFQGGEAGQPLPFNVAAVVSLRTPLAGRSHRGRAYWFGYTEASSNGIVFDPTSQAALAAAYAQFVDDLDSFTWPGELVVMSMKLATASLVSSIIVEPDWATMRKRESRLRVA
jgi:hypothetical protein